MSSQLHITNGDSFTEKLQSLKLKGDIITWREMLCEGKTETNVGSESFWKTRFEFLHKNYKVTKSWFVEKTLKEYRSLCNHKQQNQIILWFEYDLFCQINMLAVLSWLKTNRRHADIFLVCSGKEDDSNKLYGLSELTDDQLMNLYRNKVKLTQDDIEYADYIWQLYCSDNPIRIEQVSGLENYQFNYLGDALKAHLQRFPSIKSGLNSLEYMVLDYAEREKPKNREQLLRASLMNQGYYGYGDTQFNRIITNLKPLIKKFNPVSLTQKGKDVLDGKTNYYSQIRDNETYLGGALKYNFLYNTDSGRILKL